VRWYVQVRHLKLGVRSGGCKENKQSYLRCIVVYFYMRLIFVRSK
jgi:hypothetical protein